MSHALAQLLALIGFAALACGTRRQQRDLFGRALAASRTALLQMTGAAALLLALGALVFAQGWALGLVMLAGHCSLAAGLVTAALIVHGRRNR